MRKCLDEDIAKDCHYFNDSRCCIDCEENLGSGCSCDALVDGKCEENCMEEQINQTIDKRVNKCKKAITQ